MNLAERKKELRDYLDTASQELFRDKVNEVKDNPSLLETLVNHEKCPSEVKKTILFEVSQLLKSNVALSHQERAAYINVIEICANAWKVVNETFPSLDRVIDKDDPIYELAEQMKEILDESPGMVILHGPPGTSKTHTARRVAAWLTGQEKPGDRWEVVQFHPSYSYEDFIEGLMPKFDSAGTLMGYYPEQKIFKELCEKARKADDSAEPYILIIDELNRADLSKVFGELLSGLEYRGESIRLIYSPKDEFNIPENVRIIGTMNTLDKSTEDMDFAFMRRFEFLEVLPDVNILKKILEGKVEEDDLEAIVNCFEEVKQHYELGHAYFKKVTKKQDLKKLYYRKIEPIMIEYFGDLQKEKWDAVKETFIKYSQDEPTNLEGE